MLTRRQFGAGSAVAVMGLSAPFRAGASDLSGKEANGNAARSGARLDPRAFRHTLSTPSADPVGAAVILVVDVSASIADREYKAEQGIYARSLMPEDGQSFSLVEDAIRNKAGNRAAAVCMVAFADEPKLVVPWIDLRGDDPVLRAKMQALSTEIMTLPRPYGGGLTRIAATVAYAEQVFLNCPWRAAERRSLDILSDGTASDFGLLQSARDGLEKATGATVNALALQNGNEDLAGYYGRYLVTKGGAYGADGVMSAPGTVWNVARSDGARVSTDFDAAARAMRMKISIEIAGHAGVRAILAQGGHSPVLRQYYPDGRRLVPA